MKHSGLMLTSLALCCSAANAASESTYSGNTLHMPHVMYSGKMYDVTMEYQAPDKLILKTATPLTSMPSSPAIMVSNKLSFKLIDIATGGDQPYRADVKSVSETEFKVTGIAPAIHGKIIKGEKISALGYLADGSFSYAYSISDDGKAITGRSRNAKKKTVPVRFHYDHGHIEALDGQLGGRDEGRSVNNSGAIAGFGVITDSKTTPRVYNAFYNKSEKELVTIAPLDQGKDSRAYGLNNNDIVVGWSSSNADNSDHVAYSYDANSKEITALGADILGGQRSFAFDINDSDQIVGVATTDTGAAIAFLYEDGAATNLGSLDNSGYSEARAINDKGHATGWSLTADGTYAAFIHDGTSMTKISIPGAADTKGYDINTHGHVVGDSRDDKGGRHAFLYKDGQAIDLYEMLPAADKANWKELREAYSISDDGVIVGRGRFWKDKANKKDTSMAFRIQL